MAGYYRRYLNFSARAFFVCFLFLFVFLVFFVERVSRRVGESKKKRELGSRRIGENVWVWGLKFNPTPTIIRHTIRAAVF